MRKNLQVSKEELELVRAYRITNISTKKCIMKLLDINPQSSFYIVPDADGGGHEESEVKP